MGLLAGLDLGTTGCRCVLFEENLNIVGEDYYEYPLITSEGSIAEQDAELWWKLLCKSIRGASEQAGRKLAEITAICISSQGVTIVPVDEHLRPLANAINWLDHRSGTDGEEIVNALSLKRYSDITARLSPSGYGITKVMWFEKRLREKIICLRKNKIAFTK